jgi:hypothetical protein
VTKEHIQEYLELMRIRDISKLHFTIEALEFKTYIHAAHGL